MYTEVKNDGVETRLVERSGAFSLSLKEALCANA
jgi:hypothetical protein